MSNQARHGPGPIVHGPSLTDPDRYIVEQPGQPPTLMTRDEIAAIPIRHQWFRGTQTGLIASFWNREVCEEDARKLGVIVGQILPMRVGELGILGVEGQEILVLCDTDGQPLRGE